MWINNKGLNDIKKRIESSRTYNGIGYVMTKEEVDEYERIINGGDQSVTSDNNCYDTDYDDQNDETDFYSQGMIIEFKSVSQILPEHRSQLFNYLRITKLQYGILVNYGEDHFHAERYVYDEETGRYELLTKTNLHHYIVE